MRKLYLSLLSLLVLLSLTGGSAFALVLSDGSFISYEYRVVFGERVWTGVVREEVLRNYGNGTIRLKIEATFNDGVATLEKDAPEWLFVVPRLPYVAEGRFTYSDSNYTLVLESQRVGSVRVSVNGRDYLANVYSLTGSATYALGGQEQDRQRDLQIQFTGRIVLINGSGVVHSVEGELRGSGGGALQIKVKLTEANIDLTDFPAHEVNPQAHGLRLAPMLASLIGGGQAFSGIRPEQGVMIQQERAVSAGDNYSSRAMVFALLGIAVLAAVAVLPLRLRRRVSQETFERKPHYV